MTVLEYINKKNTIVEEYTGYILIPDNQKVDLPITPKMVSDMVAYLEVTSEIPITVGENPLVYANCPYCAEYNTFDTDCGNCPMELAGNNCNSSEDSTFLSVINIVRELSQENITGLSDNLRDLAKEFSDANKHIK